MNTIATIIQKYLIYILFLFLLIISSPAIYDSFYGIISENQYAFNELFINYQFGFIRRGLLGEIFYQFYKQLQIEPKKFFSIIFLFLHLILIIFYFLLLKKWKKYNFFLIIIILSPALNLFYIYEREVYFVKDVFSNITIFLHGFIASNLILNKISIEKYNNYLKFLIIPFLIFSLLIHELQFFYIPIHVLFSCICFKKKFAQTNILKKILKIYGIITVPIIIIFICRGNEQQATQISQLLEVEYGINIHSQIYAGKNYGTFLTLLGSFFVWHVYYLYSKVIILFILSLTFSVIFFYWFFQYLLEKKIINASNFTSKINKNFFLRKIMIIVIFFYICLWTLSQTAGLKVGGNIDEVFQTSLFTEMQTIFKRSYDFIRINFIYTLPKLPMHS